MGLKPLEFSEALLDSPYFRENIHEHERELDRANDAIKSLIRECKSLIKATERKWNWLSRSNASVLFGCEGFAVIIRINSCKIVPDAPISCCFNLYTGNLLEEVAEIF
jgi:hypothetical protein